MKQIVIDLVNYAKSGRRSEWLDIELARWDQRLVTWATRRLVWWLESRKAGEDAALALGDSEWYSWFRTWVLTDTNLNSIWTIRGNDIVFQDHVSYSDRQSFSDDVCRCRAVVGKPYIEAPTGEELVIRQLLSTMEWPSSPDDMLVLLNSLCARYEIIGESGILLDDNSMLYHFGSASQCHALLTTIYANGASLGLLDLSKSRMYLNNSGMRLASAITAGRIDDAKVIALRVEECLNKGLVSITRDATFGAFALRAFAVYRHAADPLSGADVDEPAVYKRILKHMADVDGTRLAPALFEAIDYHMIYVPTDLPQYKIYPVEVLSVLRLRELQGLSTFDNDLRSIGVPVYDDMPIVKLFQSRSGPYPDVIMRLVEKLQGSSPQLLSGLKLPTVPFSDG